MSECCGCKIMQTVEPEKTDSFYYLFKKLWQFFTRRRKIQLILLLGLMILASCAELISIGAVLPFLGCEMGLNCQDACLIVCKTLNFR